jgi:hypothetical protein
MTEQQQVAPKSLLKPNLFSLGRMENQALPFEAFAWLERGYYCSDCSAGNCQKTNTLVVGGGIL